MAMAGPVLDAFITRMPVVRARRMLELAEAVFYARAGGEAYVSWRRRLEQFVQGDARRAEGVVESFLSIKARRIKERQEQMAREQA